MIFSNLCTYLLYVTHKMQFPVYIKDPLKMKSSNYISNWPSFLALTLMKLRNLQKKSIIPTPRKKISYIYLVRNLMIFTKLSETFRLWTTTGTSTAWNTTTCSITISIINEEAFKPYIKSQQWNINHNNNNGWFEAWRVYTAKSTR